MYIYVRVSVCLQSHLFIIQLVHRPTVKSAVCSVVSQRLVVADQSIAKSEYWPPFATAVVDDL